MPSKRFMQRGFRASRDRWLSSLIELLVGTTRPYGRALRTVIDGALDPTRVTAGDSRGGAERDEAGMISDRESSLPRGLDSIVSLGRYDDGLGSLVASAKYEAWSLPLELLGRRLGVEAAATIGWTPGDSPDVRRPVVVPVPTCGWRRWHRGIDHTRVLAEGVARELRSPVRRLLRCRWAPTQVELDHRERRRAGGRFRVRRLASDGLQPSRTVVLVDDVCTTGETLAAVASLLRNHGVVTVHALVVARGTGGMRSFPGPSTPVAVDRR